MLWSTHVGLSPGKRAGGKGRSPHPGDGFQQFIEVHHIGQRQVQARPGKTRQVFHIGIRAHKQADLITAKCAGKCLPQVALEGLAKLGIEYALVQLGAKPLHRLLLGCAAGGQRLQTTVLPLHPLKQGAAPGVVLVQHHCLEHAKGNGQAA